MRKIVPLMTLTALAAWSSLAVPALHGAAQQPAAPEETRAADMAPAPFNPQLSALMNMLMQPRHAKLGLAGKAENWALAGYVFGELKQSVAVIGRAVPRWKGLPVPDLFDAALSQPFAVLDFAIKAGEPGQFAPSLRARDARLQQLPRHDGSLVYRDQSAGGRRARSPTRNSSRRHGRGVPEYFRAKLYRPHPEEGAQRRGSRRMAAKRASLPRTLRDATCGRSSA